MTHSSQLILRFFLVRGCSRCLGCMLLGLLLWAAGCDNDTRTIQVQTQPPGASVFIDGKLAGASPCKVQWTDARPDDLWELHVIEARAKDHQPQRKEIRYRTGEAWLPERIQMTLTATNGPAIPADQSKVAFDHKAPAWTPEREIPTANNKPPKHEPPQTQPAQADPPESAFSIWRPKGRPTDPSADPSPATVLQPPSREKPNATIAPAKSLRNPHEPPGFPTSGPHRLLACEVRLVRLSDGLVLTQASLQGPYSQREQMIDALVKLLAQDAPDDATVAVGCLSNRRRSTDGRALCDEMTLAIIRSVRQTPGLRYVKQVNLRDVILDEEMVESPKIVADRRIAHLFSGADHVIVGGAAMAVPISTRLDEPESP